MFGFEDFNFGTWWQAVPYAVHIVISIPFIILLWLFFALIRQVTKNLAVGLFYVVHLLQTILQGLFLAIFIGGLLWLIAQFFNIESDLWPNFSHFNGLFEPSIDLISWQGESSSEIDIALEPYEVIIAPTLSTPTIEAVPTKQSCRSGMYVVTGLQGLPLRIRERPGLDEIEPKGRASEGDILEILGENSEYDGLTWSPIATTIEDRITGWVASHFLEPCP